MKKLSGILLLFLTAALHAQDSGRKHLCAADTAFSRILFLKINPVPLLDFINGGCAGFTLESQLTPEYSVSLETGVYYPLAAHMSNLHGFRSGFEVRKYFRTANTPEKHTEYYIGLRYYHKQQAFDVLDSIHLPDYFPYQKKYSMTKAVDVIDFIYGRRQITWWHLSEFFAGVGLRFRENTCTGLRAEEIDNRYWGDAPLLPLLLDNGSSVYPELIVGFRFGFGLRTMKNG